MTNSGGDKIVIAKQEDGHWVYFSVRDPADHGTIIDFEQRRHGGTLYEVREALRPWLGGSMPRGVARPSAASFVARLDPIRKDVIAVRVRYEAMQPIDGQHDYLENGRKIPAHILTDPLFADRIRTDEHRSAIFPHFNQRDGLCGYEIKNYSFTSFASGGVKGLWASRIGPDDRRLVIAETAIDALSYAAIKGQSYSRYVSTAGELSPDQMLLLEAAMRKLPPHGQIILAVDHDAGGDKLSARIEAIFQALGRSHLSLVRDVPLTAGEDWNDQLRTPKGTRAPALTYRPKFPGKT
jgi:hypothetical protein